MWITSTEVKTILGISVSTWDTQIIALIPIVKQWMFGYLNNDFAVKRVYPVDYYDQRFNHKEVIYLFSNTIGFVSSSKTITDSDSNFVNAGFKANFDIRVQDSQYNDKIFSIQTVLAGVITLSSEDSLTDESADAGKYIYLEMVRIPDGLKIPFCKIIDIELHKMNAASINVEQKLSGDYPVEILKQFKPWKQPVFI